MEPIVHYLIPLIFLLAVFPKVNKKLAFSLAVLTWIIDLDNFTTFHRALTHNIFFMLIISAIFYFIINKEAMYLSLYFIGSHLILDSKFPGNALFYPLTTKMFYIVTEISENFMFNFKIEISDLKLLKPPVSYFFGTESFLFLTLISILLLIKYKDKIIRTTRL